MSGGQILTKFVDHSARFSFVLPTFSEVICLWMYVGIFACKKANTGITHAEKNLKWLIDIYVATKYTYIFLYMFKYTNFIYEEININVGVDY